MIGDKLRSFVSVIETLSANLHFGLNMEEENEGEGGENKEGEKEPLDLDNVTNEALFDFCFFNGCGF